MNSTIFRWTFVGGGNMASSLIGGLRQSGVPAGHIAAVDVDDAACARLQKAFDIETAAHIDALGMADGWVIAVKPHHVEGVCKQLGSLIKTATGVQPATETPLVVSVAAGIRQQDIHTWLSGTANVVRCMPNTPALLGQGASGLYADSTLSQTHRDATTHLLDTAGKTAWVEEEQQLDAITALSGSGPAYFFYLVEAMEQAAIELGLPEDLARDFAIETAAGASSMLARRDLSPAMLRQNVTSKGGTTAAALAVYDAEGVPQTVAKAMQAARDRAIAMADEFGN